MKPTIISCAVTGTFPTREHNPSLPVSPAEIAAACIGAAGQGAASCHYLAKGIKAPDSAALVAKAARIIDDLGGRVATVNETRELLGIA